MTTIAELQSTMSPPAAKSATPTSADAQDRFLKLLVTQMQNQDPLNPMDNAEVTTQLAQLNTVTGIEQLNKTLGQMAASSSAQQSLQAAMLVSREVLVTGNQLNVSGQPVRFGVDLPQAVDGMTVDIADAKGNVVESFQTGAQSQGTTTLEWDGLDASGKSVPPGQYVISARANYGSTIVAPATLVSRTVQSVGSAADGSIQLQLSGAGSVGIADIKRFL